MEALKRAIEICGSQAELAKRVGKTQGHVWQWLNRDRKVPAEMARRIEAATDGKVARHELRPDLYDPPAAAETPAPEPATA